MTDSETSCPIPVIGFAAFSGTGKTTLLKQIISGLSQEYRIGLIKQSHHDIEIDIPGKDSYELRKAGATQTLLCSPFRSALITEHDTTQANDLETEISRLAVDKLDLILVEGFKMARINKIEIHRKELGKPCLYPEDNNIIAIATNDNDTDFPINKLDINKPLQIMDYIKIHFLQA